MAEEMVTKRQFETFKKDVEAAYNRLEDKIQALQREVERLRKPGR